MAAQNHYRASDQRQLFCLTAELNVRKEGGVVVAADRIDGGRAARRRCASSSAPMTRSSAAF